jgi:hypothetical protein
MLPRELLEVTRRKGKIFPRFADRGELKLADRVIGIFKESKGLKYTVIKKKLKDLEDARNYKKVRSFARIIERKCTFEVSAELNPAEVRKYLFLRGYVTTKSEREELIKKAALHFDVAPDRIENVIFADREEEQILKEIPDFEPEELIKEYNLSLLQTAVFDSLRLSFWTSSNHKEIFRRIKYLGLMYEIEDDSVQITGAASIIKMTRRYGIAMAKLIPAIVRAEKWNLSAEVLDSFANKIFTLELDDSRKESFPEVEESISYDSSLEEEFSRKVKAIKPGIEIFREPGVFRAGKYAYIPDFMIKKENKEVYIEIAGFWTSEYIRRKVEKIRELKIPLILIAREDYGIDKTFGDVILFSSKIPYNAVIKKINEEFRTEIDEIELEGDVVNLNEFIEEGIAMPELIRLAEANGYAVAGTHAIKVDLLEKIRDEVNVMEPELLSDVKEVLDRYSVSEDVLEKIGYKVVWTGLFDDNARLEKLK